MMQMMLKYQELFLADSVNYATVFDGLGWNVQTIDGHDHSAYAFCNRDPK